MSTTNYQDVLKQRRGRDTGARAVRYKQRAQLHLAVLTLANPLICYMRRPWALRVT